MSLAHRLFVLVIAAISASAVAMTPEGRKIDLASDMQATGARAGAGQIPILLVVTQDHCPFCHRIKEEILRPMLISGEYGGKVLIRELLIDPGETLRDFQGQQRDAREFAHGYKVWVTPTLLYLGPDGRELRPRMLGINTMEMYGYYVDQAIEESLQKLRGGETEPYIPSNQDIGEWPPEWDNTFF